MKKSAILFLIFLVSCSAPKINFQERCVVSFQFNKCRCHMYSFQDQSRVGDAYDKELEYCDDFVGFHASSWAKEITPWFKEVRRWLKDTCDKGF